MRITDLLQDYEEHTIQLSPMEDASVKRVKELVHQKLPRRRRSKTVLLIAAVLALVGATACAVGMSLWDKAREDLGLSHKGEFPEYVEYENASEDTGDLSVRTVSALWTNVENTIYLCVENPLPEMTVERQDTPWRTTEQEFIPDDVKWTHGRVDFVSYDEETDTVLLRYDFGVRDLGSASAFQFHLRWAPSYRVGNRTVLDLGLVTVEIPALRQLRAQVMVPYDNPFLDVQGTVVAFDCYANGFRVTMEVPPFEETCALLGGHGAIAAAYWNTWAEEPTDPSEFEELDAIVAYDRSWRNPWDDFAICYKDGSIVPFEELAYESTLVYQEEKGVSFGYEFWQLQDLEQLKSIYYHGQEYLLEPIE